MELIFLCIASFLLMLAGIVCIVIPILPDTLVAWLGLLIFAAGTHFSRISVVITLLFLGAALLGILFEYLLPVIGAKRYHASRYGLIGAALGLLLGPFIFGPAGIFAGPLLGAISGEYLAGRQEQSLRSGFGVFIGFSNFKN